MVGRAVLDIVAAAEAEGCAKIALSTRRLEGMGWDGEGLSKLGFYD